MDDQARDPAEVEREIQRNADWADYLRRIDDEVRVAEEHLSVPPGAISGIQNEPEYLFIVKVFAALEPIINELLAARLTFARKINMQALLGELSGEAATPEKLPEIVAPMPRWGDALGSSSYVLLSAVSPGASKDTCQPSRGCAIGMPTTSETCTSRFTRTSGNLPVMSRPGCSFTPI